MALELTKDTKRGLLHGSGLHRHSGRRKTENEEALGQSSFSTWPIGHRHDKGPYRSSKRKGPSKETTKCLVAPGGEPGEEEALRG